MAEHKKPRPRCKHSIDDAPPQPPPDFADMLEGVLAMRGIKVQSPPGESPRSFESIGRAEATMADDPDLEGRVEQPAQPQEAGGFEEALLKLMTRLTGLSRYDGALLEDAVCAAHRVELDTTRREGYRLGKELGIEEGRLELDAARAAGVAEGRREMAREVLAKIAEIVSPEVDELWNWLEARAR